MRFVGGPFLRPGAIVPDKVFRFRRSIKLPGVRLNVSKSGIFTSIGTNGATVNIGGKDGTKAKVGIPGSGLSYTEHLHREPSPGQQAAQSSGFGLGKLLLVGRVALAVYLVLFAGR